LLRVVKNKALFLSFLLIYLYNFRGESTGLYFLKLFFLETKQAILESLSFRLCNFAILKQKE